MEGTVTPRTEIVNFAVTGGGKGENKEEGNDMPSTCCIRIDMWPKLRHRGGNWTVMTTEKNCQKKTYTI